MSRAALSLALSLLLSGSALAQNRAVTVPVEAVPPGVSGANVSPAALPAAMPGPAAASLSLAPLISPAPAAPAPISRGRQAPGGLAAPAGLARQAPAAQRGVAASLPGRAEAAAAPRAAVLAAASARPVDGRAAVREEPSAPRARSATELLPLLSARPELAVRGFDGARPGLPITPAKAGSSKRGLRPARPGGAPLAPEFVPGRSARPLPRGTGAAEARGEVPAPAAAPPAAPRAPAGSSWLSRLGDHPVLVAFLWNFVTVGAAYIVNPIRGAFLLTRFDPTVMPFVYMGSAAATALAVWVYGRFAKTGRARLVGGTIIALSASLAGWWALGPTMAVTPALAFAFYMFGDVFSILSVTVFWSYMNDVFRGEGAKKHFGRLTAAGSLGAIVMSIAVNLNVKGAGAIPLILAAAGLYALSFGLMLYMERWARRNPAESTPQEGAARAEGGGETPKAGIWKTLLSSKVALLLTLVVLLERLVPDFANFVFAFEMKAAYPVLEDFARAQASFAAWQNGIAFVAGLALSGWLVRKAGLGWGLATAAIANLIGMAAYVVSPGLSAALALNGLEGGIRYTFFKTAKEQAWSSVPRDVLFQLKAFIEAFVYRFGRGISGALLLVLTGSMFLGLGAVPVGLFQLPLAAAWIWLSWKLGKLLASRG